jgi:hypothetical protein
VTGARLIAVEPGRVVAAGHATAGTAPAWWSWAGRCGYAFSEVGRAVHDPRIARASSGYALRVVLGARRVGQRVAELGADTAAAGRIVDQTDVASASVLSRPVNRGRAPR